MRSLTRSLCPSVCVFLAYKVIKEEMDVGANPLRQSANPSRQCLEAEKEANSTVGTIRIKTVNRVKNTILRLCKCIVWPQLEYYNTGSHCKKPDMEKLCVVWPNLI